MALRHRSHPVILFNIALCYAMMKRNVEAATYARQYLAQVTGKDRALPKVVQEAVAAVGVVIVQAPDPTAEIYVNRVLAGKGRVEKVLSPGTVAVVVKIAGRVVAERSFQVSRGQVERWSLQDLSFPRARRVRDRATPPRPGTSAQPASRVGRRRLHWAWFATFSVVAAGLAAGAGVMSMKTKQAHDDFLADRTNAALRKDGRTFETTANVLWGTAAASAVAAVALAVFTRWRAASRERPSAVRLLPSVSPDGAGVSVMWTY